MKHVCSNQVGGSFLIFSVTLIIQNMFVQIKREAALVVYSFTFVIRMKRPEAAFVTRKMWLKLTG